jgi:hypothetical protein
MFLGVRPGQVPVHISIHPHFGPTLQGNGERAGRNRPSEGEGTRSGAAYGLSERSLDGRDHLENLPREVNP